MDGLSPHRRIAAGTGQLTVLIEVGTLGLFFAASIALALAPGPDNFFVLAQSAAHGVGAGLMITLGLCTGLIVHTTAVALGVAVIFQTSALAFNGLKLVGATYLLYLAWQSVRARPEELEARREQTLSPRRLFGRGVIMNITNPKVAIFFLAFLPQFADPARGSVTLQIFALGLVFIVAAALVFSLIAWGTGFLGGWLRGSATAQRALNLLAGTVFVTLAVRLAISERSL